MHAVLDSKSLLPRYDFFTVCSPYCLWFPYTVFSTLKPFRDELDQCVVVVNPRASTRATSMQLKSNRPTKWPKAARKRPRGTTEANHVGRPPRQEAAALQSQPTRKTLADANPTRRKLQPQQLKPTKQEGPYGESAQCSGNTRSEALTAAKYLLHWMRAWPRSQPQRSKR